MKIYYLLLPIFGFYFIYASYKGYPSLIGNYYRFKSEKKNENIDKVYNALFGGVLLIIFTMLICK